MSLRVSGSLTRFWLIRMTRQIQDDMSHSRVLSWRRVQVKSRTCDFVSLRIQFNSHSHIFICGSENKIGTSPLSSTSTLVELGGVVGKANDTAFPTSLRHRVGKHAGLVARAKLCGNAIMQRSGIFQLPLAIQVIVYNQDPEQRVSDGWTNFMELPSSMQHILCHTNQR